MDPLVIIIGAAALLIIMVLPVIKVVTPLFPYAYTNARIRAMKNELIKEEEFDDLLKKPYNEIIYSLGQKSYPDLSKKLSADYTYASVETAFRSTLINTLDKIMRISPKQSKPFLKVLLSKYDIQLLQSLVRMTKAKYSFKKDIFHATEVFSEGFLLKENPSMDDLVNELKNTLYEPVLTKHFEQLKKGKFKAFEEELDLLYFKRLLRTAQSKEAKTYARMIVDHHNVSLQLKNSSLFIPGGRFSQEVLKSATDAQDLAAKLQRYGLTITAHTPEQLERGLRKKLKMKGRQFMTRNPLSEASIIGFIILKNVELRALNILLKMKYHNFTEEQIREVNII